MRSRPVKLQEGKSRTNNLEDVLSSEWAGTGDRSIYLNFGSCGKKPKRVLAAMQSAGERLNSNPTNFVYNNAEADELARQEAGRLFSVAPESLLLTLNTTQALQIVLQSFLTEPGQELVTTDQEHNSLYAIARYLQEARGIVVKRVRVDPFQGTSALSEGVLKLVSDRTRLVAISEIFSTTGWRPQLGDLAGALAKTKAHLLVDGAHSPGQGITRPGRYPLWVGAGHKWLGGPNGTGFLFAQPHLVPELAPVNIGDRFYNEHANNLRRFAWIGTTDSNVRWLGLTAACELQNELGPSNLQDRQTALIKYLRNRLTELPEHQIRTPSVESEVSGMLTVTWQGGSIPVPDLSAHLWNKYQIAVRPDLFFGLPGHGIRVSCHAANTTGEIDSLTEALKETLTGGS
jgi:selenocysteine lyase/cysteine desulfurase